MSLSKQIKREGDILSPLLANIFLHCVLGYCFDGWEKRYCISKCIIIHYTDDGVRRFQQQPGSQRCLAALRRSGERDDRLRRSVVSLIVQVWIGAGAAGNGGSVPRYSKDTPEAWHATARGR